MEIPSFLAHVVHLFHEFFLNILSLIILKSLIILASRSTLVLVLSLFLDNKYGFLILYVFQFFILPYNQVGFISGVQG